MDRNSPKAEDVIAHVDRYWGAGCTSCSELLLGHDAVVGLLLGFADEPRCLTCLAQLHGHERAAFLDDAYSRVRRLACYRAGWRHADARLLAEGRWPEERLPARLRMPDEEPDQPDEQAHDMAAPPDERLETAPVTSERLEHDEHLETALATTKRLQHWDAGDRGCGELALELRTRVRRLDAGDRLLLETTDAGAPADLPAWCRLTGNLLVASAPPRYLIESRPPTSSLSNP